jgi:hypothetical protein
MRSGRRWGATASESCGELHNSIGVKPPASGRRLQFLGWRTSH